MLPPHGTDGGGGEAEAQYIYTSEGREQIHYSAAIIAKKGKKNRGTDFFPFYPCGL